MKRLTSERLARHWSSAELARRANMNAGTVGTIESGRLQPYPGQVAKLAAALGWPLERGEELLEEVST